MEGNELISFHIISAAGAARSSFIEAMRNIRKGNLEEAEQLIEKGKEDFNNAHLEHAALIQKEAAGDKVELDLLLVHAEDQIMSTETVLMMLEEVLAWAKDKAGEKV
jgi:Phosphotransferase system cellobiose-specific component IIA